MVLLLHGTPVTDVATRVTFAIDKKWPNNERNHYFVR
jgi:hypothetical protein